MFFAFGLIRLASFTDKLQHKQLPTFSEMVSGMFHQMFLGMFLKYCEVTPGMFLDGSIVLGAMTILMHLFFLLVTWTRRDITVQQKNVVALYSCIQISNVGKVEQRNGDLST